LVLSANSASTPRAPSSANRCRSKCWPSIGVWSILKSPVWMMVPAGEVMASATQSGMLCVTRMNSMLSGPIVIVSRGWTVFSRFLSSRRPCSSSFGSTSASVIAVPYTGPSKTGMTYGTPPMWSSWPCVNTSAFTCDRRAST
jgi:hypothetical protein